MTTDYHSKLISDLYKAENEYNAYVLLDDIDEVSEVCFLYPIYDAYKKFRSNGYFSNSFIGSISKIDTQESHKIIKEIAIDPETSPEDFVACLDDLVKISNFDEAVIEKAKNIFWGFYAKEIKLYSFSRLLNYLEKAQIISVFETMLFEIFLDKSFNQDEQQMALNYFLKIDPSKKFQYLIDNFDVIKKANADIVMTRIILGWKGDRVTKLINLLKEKGSTASRLLVEQKTEKDSQKKSDQESKNIEEYSNGKQVQRIGALRKKINELALTKFGHKIFPDDETIATFIETAKDRNTLVTDASNLRDVIQNIDSEAKNHNMMLVEAKQHIKDLDEASINKSMNAFHLYLISKEVMVDINLFGMRPLVKVVSLLGAHQEDEGLIPLLKKDGLIEMYNEEQWPLLHKELLERYITSLDNLSKSLVV